eukprot:scaffold114189_cov17-Tisochrysis_lutea.AAC.1
MQVTMLAVWIEDMLQWIDDKSANFSIALSSSQWQTRFKRCARDCASALYLMLTNCATTNIVVPCCAMLCHVPLNGMPYIYQRKGGHSKPRYCEPPPPPFSMEKRRVEDAHKAPLQWHAIRLAEKKGHSKPSRAMK